MAEQIKRRVNYVNESNVAARIRLARQFWHDESVVPFDDIAERINLAQQNYFERPDLTPFTRLGLPIVGGVLIDDPHTKFSEQAISVKKSGDVFAISIHVIDPDWATTVYGNYSLTHYHDRYRPERIDVPYVVGRTFSFGRNDPALSSIDRGVRPVVTFTYGLKTDGKGNFDFDHIAVAPSMIKPLLKTNLDNPESVLDDARVAVTPTGRHLRTILQATSRIRGKRQNQLRLLSNYAGVVAGQWAREQGIDLIYANQVKGQAQPQLSTQPDGHYDFDGRANAPVTAPYRNPAAYYNQRIISHYLTNGSLLYKPQQLELIAQFIDTGDKEFLKDLPHEIAWEAEVVQTLLKGYPLSRLVSIFENIPDDISTLPIRRYLMQKIRNSHQNYNLLNAIRGLQIKSEASSVDPFGRRRPHECIIYAAFNGLDHQSIGYGSDYDKARNDASFSILMSMLTKTDLDKENITIQLMKHAARFPAYVRAALEWLRRYDEHN